VSNARTDRGRFGGGRCYDTPELSHQHSCSLAHNLLNTPPTATRVVVGGVASSRRSPPPPQQRRVNHSTPNSRVVRVLAALRLGNHGSDDHCVVGVPGHRRGELAARESSAAGVCKRASSRRPTELNRTQRRTAGSSLPGDILEV